MSPAMKFICAQHWAIIPSVFDSLLQLVERHDQGMRSTVEEIRLAQAQHRADLFGMDPGSAGEPLMQVRGDTAVIPIRGVLARYSDQINGACQDQGRSAESVQADLAKATANPAISRIILRIDSPGGSVAGTAETANAILAARTAGKQTVAYVDGMAASAAYWLASQCDQVVASSPSALVGSIGVIMALVDSSKNMESKGHKVHVVRSVGLKAPGTANESLTPEQMASVQQTVADLHSIFAAAVQDGRNLTDQQMAAAGTGEVFTADKAAGMGLVDTVQSWDATLSDPSRGTRAMDKMAAQATPLPSNPAPVRKSMNNAIAQAQAIVAKHPAHAALVWEMAAKDSTEDQILAAIAAKDHEAKVAADAAELADLRAKVAEFGAKEKTLADKLAATEKELDEAKATAAAAAAQAAAAAAHVRGGVAGAKITPEGDRPTVKAITRAEYDENPGAYVVGIKARTIIITD